MPTDVEIVQTESPPVLTEVQVFMIYELKRMTDYAHVLLLDVQYHNTDVPEDQRARAAFWGELYGQGFEGAEFAFKRDVYHNIIELARQAGYSVNEIYDVLDLDQLRPSDLSRSAHVELLERVFDDSSATNSLGWQLAPVIEGSDVTYLTELLALYGERAESIPHIAQEDLDYAHSLVVGYREAAELDKRRKTLLEEAENELRGWSAEGESYTLNRLKAEIDTMRVRGTTLLDISVENIITGFEQFHALMQTRHTLLSQIAPIYMARGELQKSDEEREAAGMRGIRGKYIRWLNEELGVPFDVSWLDMSHPELDTLLQEYVEQRRLAWNPSEKQPWWLDEPITVSDEILPYLQMMPSYQQQQQQQTFVLEMVFFTLGFVPVVGQVIDVVDMLVSLERGDHLSAIVAMIPMMKEVNSGLDGLHRGARGLRTRLPEALNQYDDGLNSLQKAQSEISRIIRTFAQ